MTSIPPERCSQCCGDAPCAALDVLILRFCHFCHRCGQALEGFLSEAVDGDETKTWLDYLRGKVISDRGGYKEYAGLGARCKDTFKADGISTVSSEWQKALTAAALHTDPDDLGKDGTAVELVIAKLMQQLWSEMKSGGLNVDEADAVVKSARKFASKDMEVKMPPLTSTHPASTRPIRAHKGVGESSLSDLPLAPCWLSLKCSRVAGMF